MKECQDNMKDPTTKTSKDKSPKNTQETKFKQGITKIEPGAPIRDQEATQEMNNSQNRSNSQGRND
jgi:hypothetical protein